MKSFLRFGLFLAQVAALPFLVSAQAPAGGAGATNDGIGPVIKFDTEFRDFGKALANDSVKYTFTITNAGDAMLDISSVKPGCSCTVVNGTGTQHIAPHETGTLPIMVHTGGIGPIDKPITVTSNDKTRPTVVLHMQGVVWLPVEVTPPRAYFTVRPDAPSVPPVVMKIYNRTDQPLVLEAPQSTSPAFSAVLTTNVPGQEFELKVILNQTRPDPGTTTQTFRQAAITMITSSTNMPVVNVPADAEIQPEVTYQPAQVQLMTGPLPRALTNDINVQDNIAAPLKVLDASVNVPGVDVAIRVLTPNKNYIVVLGFPQGFQIKPEQKMMLSIKTDNPRYETIQVPIQQTQPLLRRILPPIAPVSLPTPTAGSTPPAP